MQLVRVAVPDQPEIFRAPPIPDAVLSEKTQFVAVKWFDDPPKPWQIAPPAPAVALFSMKLQLLTLSELSAVAKIAPPDSDELFKKKHSVSCTDFGTEMLTGEPFPSLKVQF